MADKKDSKVIPGDFSPRLNIGISVAFDTPYENDEMILVRTEVEVNGVKKPDYNIIMKEQD